MTSALRATAAAFGLALTVAGAAWAQEPPAGPYRFVYAVAGGDEVTFLDLDSFERDGDTALTWSLAVSNRNVAIPGVAEPTNIHWFRSRIDCAAGTGQILMAVGMRDGAPVFTTPVTLPATSLDEDWAMDKIFVCEQRQGSRIAAETYDDALAAAAGIMTPQTPAAAPASPAPAQP